MINNIYAGNGLQVSIGSSTYINMSSPSAGMVRYNGMNMEVYDGAGWLNISTTANIILNYDTREVLDWASKKMAEEAAIEKLKDNPTVADLLKQKADIEEKIQIVKILIGNNNGSDPA
jgi:hypothetical protein